MTYKSLFFFLCFHFFSKINVSSTFCGFQQSLFRDILKLPQNVIFRFWIKPRKSYDSFYTFLKIFFSVFLRKKNFSPWIIQLHLILLPKNLKVFPLKKKYKYRVKFACMWISEFKCVYVYKVFFFLFVYYRNCLL